MEVHHHPHAGKKKFREYLSEGFMIFLAVTLGFIAENIRELLSEHAKENEYILNIRKDLLTDTVNQNIWITALKRKMENCDSLIAILEVPGSTTKGKEMYYYARMATRGGEFDANTNTLDELKNSGNFRLLRKREIINSLLDYEKIILRYQQVNAFESKENELLYPMIGILFDATVFQTMLVTDASVMGGETDYASGTRSNIQKPAGNPQLRNHTADQLNQLIYYLHQRKASFLGEMMQLYQEKKAALELVTLLNNQYHLDNE